MEPRIQISMIVLLLTLVGIITVVMGQSVHSQPVVMTPEAENDTHEKEVRSDLAREASNSTACDDENAEAEDVLQQFIPCLPAVSVISQPPTTECCDQLLSRGITCLCSVFVRYRSRIPQGIVDFDKITELPRQCGVPIPEGTVCAGIPVPSPSHDPTPVLDSTETSIGFGWLRFNP